MLAEASGLLGEPEDGLAALEEALTLMEQTGERYYEAELHRQRGELLLLQAEKSHPAQGSRDQHDAETCFQQALDVSRRQEAKALELRATMSLARLWQQQGKRTEAYDLLAPVYGWFTEGFNTADLPGGQSAAGSIGVRGGALLSSGTPTDYRVGVSVAWILPRGYTALCHKASPDIGCHIHSTARSRFPYIHDLLRGRNMLWPSPIPGSRRPSPLSSTAWILLLA